MKMKYIELDVLVLARAFIKNVCLLSASFPKEELRVLVNQVKRSLVTIPSNLAEVLGRQTNNGFINYFKSKK